MPKRDDDGLAETAAAPLIAPNSVPRLVSLADPGDLGAKRYAGGDVLGVGGMGEVRLVHDERIGRDVAMKVMREGSIDPERFLREARVQGQLEHPSIVPVYDLAQGDDGLFFTMKRVRGVTLEQAARTQSRRKLLSAFVSVCLAIDFAHHRGVVHRDLKPSNVMVGDFGEVYVLDWGIAKLVHDQEPIAVDQVQSVGGSRYATQQGTVLGTVGYMAPEQLRGEKLDGRADVYALGAVLFELLTGEALHRGDTLMDLSQSTLADTSSRIRERCRALDVPPELEAICVRATALKPGDRHPSTRAVSDAIEHYLDGDRDVARRRELAREHAGRAARSVDAALGGDASARREATLEAGRALALDPECEEAARALMSLMTTPPRQTPREVVAEIEAARLAAATVAGKAGAAGFGAILLMVPLVLWMGVREWSSLSIGALALLAGIGFALATARWPRRGRPLVFAMFASATILLVVIARLFGPLLAAPTVALGLAVAGGFHPLAPRWSSVAFASLGVLLPFALELGGVIAPPYSFEPGGMLVHPMLAWLPAVPTTVYLVLSSLAVVVSVSAYVLAVRRALDDAQRTALVQSWQLRHLVPRGRSVTVAERSDG